MQASIRKLGRWLAGTLGLLALASLSPRTAEAACGPSHQRPVAGVDHFDGLFRSGGLALPDRGTPEESPAPCPGGLCSRRSPAPVAPLSPPPSRLEEWPCPLDDLSWTVRSARLPFLDAPLAYERPALPTPEHPPRRASAPLA